MPLTEYIIQSCKQVEWSASHFSHLFLDVTVSGTEHGPATELKLLMLTFRFRRSKGIMHPDSQPSFFLDNGSYTYEYQ